MARSLAFNEFRARYGELRRLLEPARQLQLNPQDLDGLQTSNAIARAAIVLLAGHLERYLNDLAREAAATIKISWSNATLGQRRIVVLRVLGALKEIDEQYRSNDFSKEAALENCKYDVERCASYFDIASAFADLQLKGFYRHNGPRAVERLLQDLHPDSKKFFDWIEGRKLDRGRVWTVLEQLVEYRTGIAHGDMTIQPTHGDARLYVDTAVVIAREADSFLRAAFPDIGSTAA